MAADDACSDGEVLDAATVDVAEAEDVPAPDTKEVVKPPPPEVCNGVDDDGDGLVDEEFVDTDSDGQKDCVDPDDTYQVVAQDLDDDELLYSLVKCPAGMFIGSTTGLVQWYVTSAQMGVHEVTVKVEDAAGNFAIQGYSLDVK